MFLLQPRQPFLFRLPFSSNQAATRGPKVNLMSPPSATQQVGRGDCGRRVVVSHVAANAGVAALHGAGKVPLLPFSLS
ncbi:hypothetical protein O3P69_014058 [Scylla paramamosain]|uniref:Uncharacterized protein n=1 Tax=Scylla paramamosain TaxID=85552 RepID=A0AAW0SSA8_SCYPA